MGHMFVVLTYRIEIICGPALGTNLTFQVSVLDVLPDLKIFQI